MPDPRNAASPRPTLTLDALPDPAWLCAPGTLAILHANARAAALQGRRPDAAGPWPDLLDQTPAEEAARLRADLARTRPGETVEILWRRADHGAAREFDMRLTPVGDGPDAAVLAVAREVVSRPRPAPAPVPAAADLLGSAGWLAAFGGWRIDLRTGALTWTDGGAVVEAGRSAPALNSRRAWPSSIRATTAASWRRITGAFWTASPLTRRSASRPSRGPPAGSASWARRNGRTAGSWPPAAPSRTSTT